MGVQGKKCCGRKGGAGSACCRHVDHQCRRLGWRCVCMRRLHYHGTSMFESAMCTGMRPVVCRWEAELSVCAACVGCACIACAHQSAVAGEEQAGRKNYHAAGHRLPATAALYKRLDWSESAIRVNGRLPIRLHQKGKPQGGFKLGVEEINWSSGAQGRGRPCPTSSRRSTNQNKRVPASLCWQKRNQAASCHKSEKEG